MVNLVISAAAAFAGAAPTQTTPPWPLICPTATSTRCPAITCPSSGGAVTTLDSNLPSCAPSGWATGRNDRIAFSCAALGASPAWGASINITGCTPTEGRAVKYCPLASGSKYTCVSGVIVGNTITFPLLSGAEQSQGCTYLDYRITVSCCT
jgi:hypothetical protein